ncbi:hypothetical protein BC332_19379 [Capsicum chinense]|nr:hypothetical protein BC332_19379 [Capsicum chinense]
MDQLPIELEMFRQQQQPQAQPEIGTVAQLLAGGIAGAVSKTCTAPLARLTILFQVQEGFRAFWKGHLVTTAHRLPYSSVNFYAYEHYKSLLKSIPGLEAGADIFVQFVGGGSAGITAAAATYPLDLVRTRLAAQRNAIYYKGICHSLCTIYRDEGFFGLYKVLGATLMGVGPRIASSTATFPLDLVRRRKQLERAGGRAHVYNSTGIMGMCKHIIRNEGFRGLYRGILPEYYEVVPSVGIVFVTYETLKKLLSQGPFDS